MVVGSVVETLVTWPINAPILYCVDPSCIQPIKILSAVATYVSSGFLESFATNLFCSFRKSESQVRPSNLLRQGKTMRRGARKTAVI